MATKGIGRNVLYWRTVAGLTQEELAAAAGVTKQYISQIENNKRIVENRSVFHAIVEALSVSPNDLTGQPFPPTNRADLVVYQVIPAVRAALDPDDPITPRDIRELALITDQAMMARMACDMPALGNHLPGLLAETGLLWFDNGNREAGVLLVKACVTGSLAFKAAGFIDLGIRLAERAETVANALGDPVCVGAARFAVAQCALTTGARKRSARLAADGANDLSDLTRTKVPPMMRNHAFAWLGALRLHAALSEAGLDGGDPDGHLAAAEVAARQVTGDPDFMEITPANVATWRVGIALERGGDAERAPDLARRVNPKALRSKQRLSRLHLDWARGEFARGDTEATIQHMLAADAAAPGDLRTRVTAVEIVNHLVRNVGRRGGSEALRDLAVRVGVGADPEQKPN
jgi:transcriptional regulator with XRE-family HTH domain